MCGDKSKIACPSKVVFFCEKDLNGVEQKDSIRKYTAVCHPRERGYSRSRNIWTTWQMAALYVLCGRLLFFAHPYCNLADTRRGQPRPRMLYPVPSVARSPAVRPFFRRLPSHVPDFRGAAQGGGRSGIARKPGARLSGGRHSHCSSSSLILLVR